MKPTLVDTSIIIDVLRGRRAALDSLREARNRGTLHASEMTRVEILVGMREHEEDATRGIFAAFTWHDLDPGIAELAGELGRTWLTANRGIDAGDLVIAATAISTGAELLTRNVKHFPMFENLQAPY